MSSFDYDKWSEIYHNKKILNIYDYLDESDINLLNKLGVKIEENSCSEYQYDIIKQQLSAYYVDEEESPEVQEELKKYQKSLEEAGVTQDEYDALLEKFDSIDEIIYSRV